MSMSRKVLLSPEAFFIFRLEEADELPPQAADKPPGDKHVEGTDDGSPAEDLRDSDVACAGVHCGLARGKVGHTGVQAGEVAEAEGRRHSRDTGGQEHGKEAAVESSDVAGLTGKHVVHEEVGEAEHRPDNRPAEAEACQGAADGRGEVGDDTMSVELAGHAGEDGEPHEGVPGSLVLKALLPGQDTREHEGGEAHHGSCSGGHSYAGPEDPQHQGCQKDQEHGDLGARHGTHLLEPLACNVGRLRCYTKVGWGQLVDEPGCEEKAQQARHSSAFEPGDVGVRDDYPEFRCKLEGQEVLSSTAEEHG
mmetsp:Transcript_577/g.1742  ORF Transcript_577/g.1742 Transcript_577/m.1742 type:complete len:307 (+) Transcript_577:263-1183(+)